MYANYIWLKPHCEMTKFLMIILFSYTIGSPFIKYSSLDAANKMWWRGDLSILSLHMPFLKILVLDWHANNSLYTSIVSFTSGCIIYCESLSRTHPHVCTLLSNCMFAIGVCSSCAIKSLHVIINIGCHS